MKYYLLDIIPNIIFCKEYFYMQKDTVVEHKKYSIIRIDKK